MSETNGTNHQDLPKPWRRTPLIHSTILSKHAGCQIYLKLENLQPSGSFKSRGIGNLMLSHLTSHSHSPDDQRPVHFYSSSGGNAGMACVHASVTLSTPATIVVPLSTSAYMISKLRAAGAFEVLQHGASWIDADTYLRETVIPDAQSRGENAVYVPPFDDPLIWAGHSTLVDEVVEDMGEEGCDAIVCSVGGGGLFCGIMQGLERHSKKSNSTSNHLNTSKQAPQTQHTDHKDPGNAWSRTQILALETQGAHSLSASLRSSTLSTLPSITSLATTLGARTVCPKAFTYAHENPLVKSIVLSDRDAMSGCVRFAEDERMMVELACGVSLAVCYKDGLLGGVLRGFGEETKVVVVVCGGVGVSLGLLEEWEGVMRKGEGI